MISSTYSHKPNRSGYPQGTTQSFLFSKSQETLLLVSVSDLGHWCALFWERCSTAPVTVRGCRTAAWVGKGCTRWNPWEDTTNCIPFSGHRGWNQHLSHPGTCISGRRKRILLTRTKCRSATKDQMHMKSLDNLEGLCCMASTHLQCKKVLSLLTLPEPDECTALLE